MIGKNEELALLALVRAGPDAQASKVYAQMEENLKNPPHFAALYTALDRMTKRGLITERPSEGEGRKLRLFTITGVGRRALNEALNASHALGAGVAAQGGFA